MGTSPDMPSIEAHVDALNACNQRGGRMLSLIDLLKDESVSLPMAGYLAAAMRGGASLLVGANPGGAGKTTVMCALAGRARRRSCARSSTSCRTMSRYRP